MLSEGSSKNVRILFLFAKLLIVFIFSTTGQGFTDTRKKRAIQQYKKLVRKEQRRKGDLHAHSAGGKDAQHTSQQVEKRKHNQHKDTLVPLLFPCFLLFRQKTILLVGYTLGQPLGSRLQRVKRCKRTCSL